MDRQSWFFHGYLLLFMAVHGLQWLSSLWENNLEILASQHIMEIGKST